MTYLPGSKHPRQPEWRGFLCDCCGERFFAPADEVPFELHGFRTYHLCDACWRLDDAGLGRAPALLRDRGAMTDRIYHGDQWSNGEW